MLSRLRARLSPDKGLTLVELLVVMTILTVVGTMVTTSVVSAFGGSRRAQARVEAITDLQKGMERVTRELRAAYGVDSSVASFPAVEVAETSEVQVNILRNGQRIRYTYEVVGGDLRESRDIFPTIEAETWTTVADSDTGPFIRDIRNADVFSYFYYDAELEQVLPLPSTPTDLQRRNIVRIGMNLERGLAEQAPITIETQVNLRNTRE